MSASEGLQGPQRGPSCNVISFPEVARAETLDLRNLVRRLGRHFARPASVLSGSPVHNSCSWLDRHPHFGLIAGCGCLDRAILQECMNTRRRRGGFSCALRGPSAVAEQFWPCERRPEGHCVCRGSGRGPGRLELRSLFCLDLCAHLTLRAVCAEDRAEDEPEHEPHKDRRGHRIDRVSPEFLRHLPSVTRDDERHRNGHEHAGECDAGDEPRRPAVHQLALTRIPTTPEITR